MRPPGRGTGPVWPVAVGGGVGGAAGAGPGGASAATVAPRRATAASNAAFRRCIAAVASALPPARSGCTSRARRRRAARSSSSVAPGSTPRIAYGSSATPLAEPVGLATPDAVLHDRAQRLAAQRPVATLRHAERHAAVEGDAVGDLQLDAQRLLDRA